MGNQIIPFGDRILVKRKKVKDVAGNTFSEGGVIERPEGSMESETELATVQFMPDWTFADKALIDNADGIIEKFTSKASEGDPDAFKALLEYNQYLKYKSIDVGDEVFISRYVGTTFSDNKGMEDVTIVRLDDIIGVVKKQ